MEETPTQTEKASLGMVILVMTCCAVGALTAMNSVKARIEEDIRVEKASPAPVTKISAEWPGVSWTAEKTNTVVRWPKPSGTK